MPYDNPQQPIVTPYFTHDKYHELKLYELNVCNVYHLPTMACSALNSLKLKEIIYDLQGYMLNILVRQDPSFERFAIVIDSDDKEAYNDLWKGDLQTFFCGLGQVNNVKHPLLLEITLSGYLYFVFADTVEQGIEYALEHIAEV